MSVKGIRSSLSEAGGSNYLNTDLPTIPQSAPTKG